MAAARTTGGAEAMTLLLSHDALLARRPVAAGPLEPLARSLAADFETVINRPLYVPEQKALLSREGGRCPRDGTMLDFDPFSPQAHTCPRCGEIFTGELHHRFWVYWYQLWLAERAVHGALLGALGVTPKGTSFASSVLDRYCDLYPTYPNVDNALGPTRPFFSTYLESIWLLQLCVALDLIEASADSPAHKAVGGRFRDGVIAPSRSLIRSYDEGMSNRQVWNNAAMIAASRMLGRDEDAEYIVWSESGLGMHLSNALLPDGTWYEGENYHLFAHRGLWYGATMAQAAGVELPAQLVERFDAGFSTPFLTALPDFTLPSRRDSQYAISLRQWRFAEMCELGLARRANHVALSAAKGKVPSADTNRILLGALSGLYAADIVRGDTGRAWSSAEAERNLPASALTRADLGWKSLLFALPDVPAVAPSPLPSVLLEAQGVGVLRRDAGRVYAALDYGHSGGGHGHPDRLNLLLATGTTRWLDDYGTGSYVDPSLHWYRSTLAHNAPLIDGRSQRRVDGELIAFEDGGGAGWVSASASIASGVSATRTIVAMPDYLVDELTWNAPGARFVDLPLHVDAAVMSSPAPEIAGFLEGGDGIEDGFRFLRDTMRVASVAKDETIHLRASRDGASLDLWVAGDAPFELWRASALAAPGQGDARFLIVRSRETLGALRAIWSWSGLVRSASFFPTITVMTNDGRHEHERVAHGWTTRMFVGEAHSTIDLEGLAPQIPAPAEGTYESDEQRAVVLKPDNPLRLRLGEESYRRSEESWTDAGEPTAEIVLVNENGGLVVEVSATNVDQTFAAPGATNRLDNEQSDINGAGIQLYLRTDDAIAGYVIVPVPDSDRVRVRPIDEWGSGIPVDGIWTRTGSGYVIEVRVGGFDASIDAGIDVDVVVNEKPAGRERRRGQLVLSGGAGEFVYLRGDRHDPARLIPFLLTDV